MKRVVVLTAVAALVVPGTAGAHLRTSRSAVDFRAFVLPSHAPVRARIYQADLALGLTLLGRHRVVVLGYLGEPFIRLDPAGVFVNVASPTAAGTKLASPHPRASGPVWHRDWNRPVAIWHDARVRAGAKSGRWRIPLLVDGRRTSLAGQSSACTRRPGGRGSRSARGLHSSRRSDFGAEPSQRRRWEPLPPRPRC